MHNSIRSKIVMETTYGAVCKSSAIANFPVFLFDGAINKSRNARLYEFASKDGGVTRNKIVSRAVAEIRQLTRIFIGHPNIFNLLGDAEHRKAITIRSAVLAKPLEK